MQGAANLAETRAPPEMPPWGQRRTWWRDPWPVLREGPIWQERRHTVCW